MKKHQPRVTVALLSVVLLAGLWPCAVAAPPAGRSYSSGGRSAGSPGRSSSVGAKPPSSGSRTYGSGQSSSGSPAPPSSASKSSGSAPSTKALPGGNPASKGAGATQAPGQSSGSGNIGDLSKGMRPSGKSYDAAAGRAQQQQESKQAYLKGSQPRSSYVDAGGQTRNVDPKDQRIESLRRELNEERWTNRRLRQDQWFGPYYGRPVVAYHDPFNTFFWWWMLDQSLDTRARWAYHHRAEMDEARYRDLLARDKALEARVKELEAEKVQQDPTYTPPGIEPDLMYTDEFAEAAYNPQPPSGALPPGVYARTSGSGWGGKLLTLALTAALLGGVVWLVFFKRWNVG